MLAKHYQRITGFTLIELMIVVAIIGILAIIAIPSYQEYVRKSRRADAAVAISKTQQAQERYRANQTSYSDDFGSSELNLVSTATAAKMNSENGYYELEIASESPTGYIVTATALGSQTADTGCTSLTLTVENGNATRAPASCWQK